jgi:hypothetical protein
MMQQRAIVHYLDGSTEEATITQYDIAQFDRWAARNGFAASKAGRALMQEMPVLFMRFGAWSALFRGVTTGKPSFDSWDPTVIEVEAVESDPVDPTQTDTPDEALPD